jgi:tripartite-type tricarboxylate transporter receptor subunit TctC
MKRKLQGVKKHMTAVRHALALALALAAAAGSAAAQGFPNKPITIVVPAGAGGPTDTVARLVGESMSRTLGQQIIVENVGGAGGTIGVARVAKSAPDGYSLVVWHIGQATAPALYENLKYNVLDDFDGVGRITDVPMTIVGKAALEAKTVGDLLAWVKAKQKDVTYAHAGIGSASHLCALLFMSAVGAEMTAVSYRGTGPAMNDLVGGQFDMMCDQTTGTTGQSRKARYAAAKREGAARLPALSSGLRLRCPPRRPCGRRKRAGGHGPSWWGEKVIGALPASAPSRWQAGHAGRSGAAATGGGVGQGVRARGTGSRLATAVLLGRHREQDRSE